MSQINVRKRKGDHLDGQPITANRGYLSINMLDNIHSVTPGNTVMAGSEPAAAPYIHPYRPMAAAHPANSTILYGAPNGPHFQVESQNSNPHTLPNKLLILNSNTNSSSGSGVDESSRSEFGVSIDNLSDVVGLTHANSCPRKQRHETSLGQLTKKFVGLLQDKQGVSVIVFALIFALWHLNVLESRSCVSLGISQECLGIFLLLVCVWKARTINTENSIIELSECYPDCYPNAIHFAALQLVSYKCELHTRFPSRTTWYSVLFCTLFIRWISQSVLAIHFALACFLVILLAILPVAKLCMLVRCMDRTVDVLWRLSEVWKADSKKKHV